MIAKVLTACALLWLAFANICVASERDPRIDVIELSTHIVVTYLEDRHKASDSEAQFIEDVVIPSVERTVRNDKVVRVPAYYDSLLDFFITSQPMASEEISVIASNVYQSQKKEFCAAFVKVQLSRRSLAVTQVQSGFASTGRPIPSDVCK